MNKQTKAEALESFARTYHAIGIALSLAIYSLALWGYIWTNEPPDTVADTAIAVAVMVLAVHTTFLAVVGRLRQLFRGIHGRVMASLILPGLIYIPVHLHELGFKLLVSLLAAVAAEAICWRLARWVRNRPAKIRPTKAPLPSRPVRTRATRNDNPMGELHHATA